LVTRRGGQCGGAQAHRSKQGCGDCWAVLTPVRVRLPPSGVSATWSGRTADSSEAVGRRISIVIPG
jgi:hypothetical protein